MADADFLFEEEDEVDENILLLNFYGENLHFLRHVPLHRIPDRLKFEAAALFFATSLYEFEWKGILEDLGVDNITMSGLDFESYKTGNLPIYLALNGILKNNRSFGDFIAVLCRREKFHILLRFKPFVEDLINARHFLNEERPSPSAPDFSADSCGSGVNHSTEYDTECNAVTCEEIREKHMDDHKAASESFRNSKANVKNKKRLSILSDFLINQPTDELISVFIMHSMLDKKYAKKLAACLQEKNFRVITSGNIFYNLRENLTLIMKLVNEKVDIIIPVISESFMNQIKPTGYNNIEEKDIESVANTFMYDCLLNEYISNFRNRRVRPVCYSLESKKLKNSDQILSWIYYLPYDYFQNDQYLEFLKLLRSSKKRLSI